MVWQHLAKGSSSVLRPLSRFDRPICLVDAPGVTAGVGPSQAWERGASSGWTTATLVNARCAWEVRLTLSCLLLRRALLSSSVPSTSLEKGVFGHD